ncbi:MAG: NUDIX domain-containing protein [Planctomycetes bacterium]|nr:NUDIX domain-containing protein [Planctomycetota bacterium]
MKISVGAVILNSSGDQILLLRRRQSPEADKWTIPGGRVEPGEAPHEALVRELKEELASASQIIRYIGQFQYAIDELDSPIASLCYLVELLGNPVNAEPEHHSELRWFPMICLPELLAQPATYAAKMLPKLIPTTKVVLPKNVNVLLIQPFFPFADEEALSLPLGLASLIAVLRSHGISAEVLDCNIATDYTTLIRLQSSNLSVPIVGVQFHSDMSVDWARRECAALRRSLPNTIMIGGGEVGSSTAEELVRTNVVDIVVRGEGETTFTALCSAILANRDWHQLPGLTWRTGNKVESTLDAEFITDLDCLPKPDIDAFRWKQYGQWSLFTARGCPFRCTFCSSAAFWRHSVRYHSPERVLEEIERLVQHYSASDIYFADDTFTLNRNRILKLCSLLLLRRIRVRWSCLTRADCVDEELLVQMAAAGCVQISFGLESANDRVLDDVKKNLSMSDVSTALALCRQCGIRSRVSVILGLPSDDIASLGCTLRFLCESRPNEVQIYGLTPHDGTNLYGNLTVAGVHILQEDQSLWSRNALNPVCETNNLTALQIRDAALQFVHAMQELGYVYLNEALTPKKRNLERTVATSFTPIQGIRTGTLGAH